MTWLAKVRGPCSVLLLTSQPLVAQEAASTNDMSAVSVAVEAYFNGITDHDTAALQRAFAPEARLMFVRPDASIYESSFADWSAFAERPPAPEGKVNHLVSIDVTGTAAVAKTELFWPGVHYVDYLSLLKMDGEWRIVQKIWWQERRE